MWYMPGWAKLVRTSATKPGTTIVLTLVSGSRKPCTTSALVSRNFTGVSTGTLTQCGTKSYCSPMSRTVAEPSGSIAVPRLLSTNSPPRWSVSGSITSTLLDGCNPPATPVMTMTVIITTSIAAMIMAQWLSVRVTTVSGTTPSGSGRCSGFDGGSANGSSRQKEEEIERHPADEQQRHGDAGDDERADRCVLERLGRPGRPDWRGETIMWRGGG